MGIGQRIGEVEAWCTANGGEFWHQQKSARGCRPSGRRGSGTDAFYEGAVLETNAGERPTFTQVYFDPTGEATMIKLRFGPNHPDIDMDDIGDRVRRTLLTTSSRLNDRDVRIDALLPNGYQVRYVERTSVRQQIRPRLSAASR